MTDAQRNALNDHLTATYAVGEDGQVAPIAGGDPIGQYTGFGAALDPVAMLPADLNAAIANDDDELTEADVREAAQAWANASAPAVATVATRFDTHVEAQGRTNGWLTAGIITAAIIGVVAIFLPRLSPLETRVAAVEKTANTAKEMAETARDSATSSAARAAQAAAAAAESQRLASQAVTAAERSATAAGKSQSAANRSATAAGKSAAAAANSAKSAKSVEADMAKACAAVEAAKDEVATLVARNTGLADRLKTLEGRTTALEQNVLDVASGLDLEVEHSKHKGFSGREEKKLVAEVSALYADLVAAYGDTTIQSAP